MFWKLLSGKTRPLSHAQMVRDFLTHPDHQWIRRNRVLQDRIVDLLTRLSESQMARLLGSDRTSICFSDALWSCTFAKERNENVILVYPNLLKLFLSAEFPQAQSILAHELGHILLGHNKKTMNLIQAQLEADQFAKSLGFADELALALLDFPIDQEIVTRVEKLKGRT